MAAVTSPVVFNPEAHKHLIPSIVATHESCILHPPYSGGTFLPPLDLQVMQAWWQAQVEEVEAGVREILIHIVPKAGAQDEEEEVVGVVMLNIPVAPTAPFRGYVEKLCVKHEWRGRGIAGQLMKLLDRVALKRGRTVLMLDTEGGSPAEFMYSRWGWTRLGAIPKFEISAGDGSLKDTVYFYKDLR